MASQLEPYGIAVMHLGRVVELGQAAAVVADPRHPYTEALLSAVPRPDPVAERRREPILLTQGLTDTIETFLATAAAPALLAPGTAPQPPERA